MLLISVFAIAVRTRKTGVNFVSIYLVFLIAVVATNYFSIATSNIVNIASPLKGGEFYILQGGNNPLLNAHRFSNAQAQFYAFDITKISSAGRRTSSFLGTNSLFDYLIFGEPVYSPCTGKIVATENQFDNMNIGEQDESNPAGNYVAIDCDGDFVVVLAHLQRFIEVTVGRHILTGERIGFVGNSGNTTEPHLHLHAVSGKSQRPEDILFHSEGLKLLVNGKTLIKNTVLSLE